MQAWPRVPAEQLRPPMDTSPRSPRTCMGPQASSVPNPNTLPARAAAAVASPAPRSAADEPAGGRRGEQKDPRARACSPAIHPLRPRPAVPPIRDSAAMERYLSEGIRRRTRR